MLKSLNHKLQNDLANTVNICMRWASFNNSQRNYWPCRTHNPHTVSKTKKTFHHFVQNPLPGYPFSVYPNLVSLKSASPRRSSDFFPFLSYCSPVNTYTMPRQYVINLPNINLPVWFSVTRPKPPRAKRYVRPSWIDSITTLYLDTIQKKRRRILDYQADHVLRRHASFIILVL